jgi:hypothetical protein
LVTKRELAALYFIHRAAYGASLSGLFAFIPRSHSENMMRRVRRYAKRKAQFPAVTADPCACYSVFGFLAVVQEAM